MWLTIPMHVERYTTRTVDGWTLGLYRGTRPGVTPGPPVLFVPGFGMNSFIFRFHPRGGSFMESLLDAGLDPWSVDLRGHETSRPRTGDRVPVGLADYAFTDLPAAFDFVAEHTGHERVHAIGCSLGGTLLYAYTGVIGGHRVDRLVTIGTPLRWTVQPLVIAAFGRLAPLFARIPMRGTRPLARLALPIAARLVPWALSVYLNPALTHTSPIRELVRTVEDPQPRVNRQLGRWIRAQDLRLGTVDVTEAIQRMTRPLLVVAGSGDQICPPSAAFSALEHAGGRTAALIVGSAKERVSHADLFISDLAPERIFGPVARFLLAPEAA